jgi:hypothetical protein
MSVAIACNSVSHISAQIDITICQCEGMVGETRDTETYFFDSATSSSVVKYVWSETYRFCIIYYTHQKQ